MRLFENWVKTTLKEDREIYRALFDALLKGPSPRQQRVLSLVKLHHLNGNRDLTRELYDSFLELLAELEVRRPTVTTSRSDPEQGSWYPIPGVGKRHRGKTKTECLAPRRAKRAKFWEAEATKSGYDIGELELILAEEDSIVGQMINTIVDELNDVEATLENRIAALATRVAKLEAILEGVES